MLYQVILKILMRELKSFAIFLKLRNLFDVWFEYNCESCYIFYIFRSVFVNFDIFLISLIYKQWIEEDVKSFFLFYRKLSLLI